MIDTRHLVTFEAAVRTGTFAGAARELGYTQPGVSQQIRALERNLNAALFTRSGRLLRLTDEGEALAAQVDALLAGLHATEERIAAVSRLRRGLVKVCAFPSANATLVPTAISRMRDEHLGIEIELSEAEPPESLEILRRGDCDVAVTFHYEQETQTESDEFVSILLLREPLLLLMPNSHPLARRHTVKLDELSEERWVAGCVRCRGEFVDACREAGFTPRIDITTDDNLAVQSYVVSGLGLAMMPRMVQAFLRHPGLRARPVLPERERSVMATVLRSNRRAPAVEHTIASLTRAAEQLSTQA